MTLYIKEDITIEEALGSRTLDDFINAEYGIGSYVDIYNDCYKDYITKTYGAEKLRYIESLNPVIAHGLGAIVDRDQGYTLSSGFPTFGAFLKALDEYSKA